MDEISYQQHLFFVIYQWLFLMSLCAPFPPHCPHAWLTPPSPLLSPTTLLSLFLLPRCTRRPPSNFLSSCIPLFQPLCESLPSTLCLSLFSCLTPSHSLRLCCRAFLSRIAHCGKTTHYEKRGGWRCGEGSSSVIKVTLSTGGGGELVGGQMGGGEWVGGKMGAGVQSWGNCMPTVAACRDQQPPNHKSYQCQHFSGFYRKPFTTEDISKRTLHGVMFSLHISQLWFIAVSVFGPMLCVWICSLPSLCCPINQVGQRGRTREKGTCDGERVREREREGRKRVREVWGGVSVWKESKRQRQFFRLYILIVLSNLILSYIYYRFKNKLNLKPFITWSRAIPITCSSSQAIV